MSLGLALPLAIAVGCVLGSIPLPFILGKLADLNLFQIGSKNPGAANQFREIS